MGMNNPQDSLNPEICYGRIIGDKDEQLLNCLGESPFQWPMKLFDSISNTILQLKGGNESGITNNESYLNPKVSGKHQV